MDRRQGKDHSLEKRGSKKRKFPGATAESLLGCLRLVVSYWGDAGAVLWEAVCDWLFFSGRAGVGGYGRLLVIGCCLSIWFACAALALGSAPFKGFPVEFNSDSTSPLQTEVTSQVRKWVSTCSVNNKVQCKCRDSSFSAWFSGRTLFSGSRGLEEISRCLHLDTLNNSVF